MKFTTTILTLFVAQAALAETTLSTPITGAWTLKRGITTVASASGPMSDCRAGAAIDAESRRTTATYTCTQPETLTATYTAAPVQCASTQPVSETQQASCPAGSYGSFTQTRSYALQSSPTCWVASAWTPTTAPAGACSTVAQTGSFTTTFDTAEAKLREGGAWTRANNAWTDMKVVGGVAYPNNGVTNSYDDSYAYLTQSFGNNYEIEGIVWRDPSLPSGAANEISLLLRTSDDTSNVRTYEMLWQAYGGQQIMRWNGPFGSFTSLAVTELSYFNRPLQTGDVLKATAIGNVLTMYVNGVATYRASDSSFGTGQPGIGGFLRPGYNSTGIGWTQIKATAK